MLSKLFGKKRKKEQNAPFLGVTINKNVKSWPEFFNVSPERKDIVEQAMKDVLKKHAGKEGPMFIKESDMVYDFLNISNDPSELMYCIFQAGRKTQEVYELGKRENDPREMIMNMLLQEIVKAKETSHPI